MMIVVSYDVKTSSEGGKRRLRRVAKACTDYGQRVQNSVFECIADPAQWTKLKHTLLKEFDEKEDSLRFYFLGSRWQNKTEHHGVKTVPNPEADVLII